MCAFSLSCYSQTLASKLLTMDSDVSSKLKGVITFGAPKFASADFVVKFNDMLVQRKNVTVANYVIGEDFAPRYPPVTTDSPPYAVNPGSVPCLSRVLFVFRN